MAIRSTQVWYRSMLLLYYAESPGQWKQPNEGKRQRKPSLPIILYRYCLFYVNIIFRPAEGRKIEEDAHEVPPSPESAAYSPAITALTWRDSPPGPTPHRA